MAFGTLSIAAQDTHLAIKLSQSVGVAPFKDLQRADQDLCLCDNKQ
jgi:hypothetical protein